MLTEGFRLQLKMWLKDRYASRPLAISDEINLNLMLAIMSEDPI
jgi:hypothetical protein